MGAQKDGGGQSEGLKVREVVCDLLMEVPGTARRGFLRISSTAHGATHFGQLREPFFSILDNLPHVSISDCRSVRLFVACLF